MRPFPVFSSWPPVRSRFVVERLRSLHRWLAKALIVAGLLLTWVTHSAHAAGKASWSVGRRFTGSTGGCARLPAQTSTARM